MPIVTARRLAAATMKPTCNSFASSNTIAFGKRFGGDQNGKPVVVVKRREEEYKKNMTTFDEK